MQNPMNTTEKCSIYFRGFQLIKQNIIGCFPSNQKFGNSRYIFHFETHHSCFQSYGLNLSVTQISHSPSCLYFRSFKDYCCLTICSVSLHFSPLTVWRPGCSHHFYLFYFSHKAKTACSNCNGNTPGWPLSSPSLSTGGNLSNQPG